MKYAEFTKIAQRISDERHIPIEEVEFEVSLRPEDTPAEDGIRYFGEIHELMADQGSVMILSDGTRNVPKTKCPSSSELKQTREALKELHAAMVKYEGDVDGDAPGEHHGMMDRVKTALLLEKEQDDYGVDRLEKERNLLRDELENIVNASSSNWEMPFEEFLSEFKPWAQSRARNALSRVGKKGEAVVSKENDPA